MCLKPQRAGSACRIDPGGPPPRRLVATAVNFAMVAATQGNREFVADFSAEGSSLRKPKVVRVRRTSPADEARLSGRRTGDALCRECDAAPGSREYSCRRSLRHGGEPISVATGVGRCWSRTSRLFSKARQLSLQTLPRRAGHRTPSDCSLRRVSDVPTSPHRRAKRWSRVPPAFARTAPPRRSPPART